MSLEGLEGLEEFDITMTTVHGKQIPVIKAKTEKIINKDGSESVIIKVPSLNLINKSMKK